MNICQLWQLWKHLPWPVRLPAKHGPQRTAHGTTKFIETISVEWYNIHIFFNTQQPWTPKPWHWMFQSLEIWVYNPPKLRETWVPMAPLILRLCFLRYELHPCKSCWEVFSVYEQVTWPGFWLHSGNWTPKTDRKPPNLRRYDWMSRVWQLVLWTSSHFMTGNQTSLKKICKNLGFASHYLEVHPS